MAIDMACASRLSYASSVERSNPSRNDGRGEELRNLANKLEPAADREDAAGPASHKAAEAFEQGAQRAGG